MKCNERRQFTFSLSPVSPFDHLTRGVLFSPNSLYCEGVTWNNIVCHHRNSTCICNIRKDNFLGLIGNSKLTSRLFFRKSQKNGQMTSKRKISFFLSLTQIQCNSVQATLNTTVNATVNITHLITNLISHCTVY